MLYAILLFYENNIDIFVSLETFYSEKYSIDENAVSFLYGLFNRVAC